MGAGALPVTRLLVDGEERTVLVDTGSTDNIIYSGCCRVYRRRKTVVRTLSGDPFTCCGVCSIRVRVPRAASAQLAALVVDRHPLGLDMILGMSGIMALGGVYVLTPSELRFCGTTETTVPRASMCLATESIPAPLVVDTADFTARFNPNEKIWTVSWKWRNRNGPQWLKNDVAEYHIADDMRDEFTTELKSWIKEGWLLPYDEKSLGPALGLIPLMAVEQQSKAKIRPVFDYRELNRHVTSHTADADVCAEQLRKWRRHGKRVAVVDLKKAYLQLRTEKRLWPYQTVIVEGKRYALTRVGFGLNVAPMIMKAVVGAVLSQRPEMGQAVLPYVDDLCVNEDMVSADDVVAHFANFGLECKPPQRATEGARFLGLKVKTVKDELCWTRDNAIGDPPSKMTRRSIFSWCGRLVGHLPVGGWLRPAAAWLKRSVNALTQGWDDETNDARLREHVDDVARRLASDDPARGAWCVSGDRAVVWTDASSIAYGVVIETEDGAVAEDACWLRREDTAHINMAELDAMVRGVNLAIVWGMKTVQLKTDSATVHRWVEDALTGRARLRTKAQGEMLIRRRIDLIRQLQEELGISLSVQLVPSAENRADVLTRVPSDWLRGGDAKQEEIMPMIGNAPSVAPVTAVAATATEQNLLSSIARTHQDAGHPGVRRTLYFARREINRSVTRKMAQLVVRQCQICQSVDPAPVKWRHGSLEVSETWWRLAIDITHFKGQSYLTVIDCGPARFCLWRPLRRMDAACVVERLADIFYERGSPVELLADNDTAFRSRIFAAFASRWGIRLRFRAVYRPSGNSIVERNHRAVKVIAARKQCSIAEAVHLYNATPKDASSRTSAPASGVYRYPVRDCVRHPAGNATQEIPPDLAPVRQEENADAIARYCVGDNVWMRKPGTRCTEKSKPGVVTRVVSPQVVEVGGTPWHVRDLRHRQVVEETDGPEERPSETTEMDVPLYIAAPAPWATMQVTPAPRSQGAADVTTPYFSTDNDLSSTSNDSFVSSEVTCIEEPTQNSGAVRPDSSDGGPDVAAPSPPTLRRSTRLRQPPDRLTYR